MTTYIPRASGAARLGAGPETIEDDGLDFDNEKTSKGTLPLNAITNGPLLRSAVTYFARMYGVFCVHLVDAASRVGMYNGEQPCFTKESFDFARSDPILMNS